MSQEAAKEMFWNLSLNTDKARYQKDPSMQQIMKGVKIPLATYASNKTKYRASVATSTSNEKLIDVVTGQKMDLDTNFQIQRLSVPQSSRKGQESSPDFQDSPNITPRISPGTSLVNILFDSQELKPSSILKNPQNF